LSAEPGRTAGEGIGARFRARCPGAPWWSLLFYDLARSLVWLLFVLVYRLRCVGSRRVPDRGALLIVANHVSFLDPPAVGVCIPRRQLDYMARMGLFKNRAFGGLISALHSIPVREDGKGDTAAIKAVLERLEQGRAVLIFPEGSRSADGRMQAFKRGVAVLVKRAPCPVLPVGIAGAHEAWPRGRRLPRVLGQRVGVAFGEPIGHEELMAGGADEALRRLEGEVGRLAARAERLVRRG
jgi:1-acyl-sn-glycerol-3-phosphate acyltransferase